MDPNILKESISLQQVAERFSISLTGCCPFPDCGSSKAFKVRDDRWFKCYRCGRSGSIFDLLIQSNKASSFQEAYRAISREFSNSNDSRQYHSRVSTIQKMWECYLNYGGRNPNVLIQYCRGRGWDTAPSTHPVGYAPHPHFLREHGFGSETLKTLGFLQGQDELYRHHLIWPVHNAAGQVVHLCGRSLDPNDSLRWCSSPGKPPISRYLYNEAATQNTPYCIVAEGISDTYSLIELGEPAVGTFGINGSLLHHVERFRSLEYCIAFYDRDRFPLGHPQAGQYISWSQMVPHLIDLVCELRIPMFCAMVPDWPGIKDINDYLIEIEYCRNTFKEHLRHTAISIHDIAFELYREKPQYHDLIWRLHAAVPNPEALKRLEGWIESRYSSWSQYCIERS